MGKDTSQGDAAGQAALAQTQMARQLFSQSAPARRSLFSDAEGFLEGGRDVTGLPEFAAAKGASEAQFGRARDNIIASTPTGGGLTAALAGLEGTRASNQTAFTGDLASREIDRATALATGGAVQGLQGQGSAGFLQSQLAGTEAMQNAGKSSGAGQAAGSAAALAALTKGGSAGASAGSAGAKTSDRRLKRNIKHIGMYGPHNLYSFDYLDGVHGVGVMAQEMPDKYVSEVNGYLMVNYGMLSNG